VALPFAVPWTFRAKGPFRVEAGQRADVRVRVGGVLDRVLVAEGDSVRAGAPLALLWNAAVEVDVLERERRVGLLRIAHADAVASGDRNAVASAAAALEQGVRELAIVRTRRDRLSYVPRSAAWCSPPIGGTRRGGARGGRPAARTRVAGGRVARVRIPAPRAADLAPGQAAGLKLSAWPGHKFASRVATVSPEVRGGHVEVEIAFPAEAYSPAPGMGGVAKIVTGRGTLADALGRAIRRTVRLDLWL
jgi:multidrug efflux pump subunit AcrA (membrane-fusion protein)